MKILLLQGFVYVFIFNFFGGPLSEERVPPIHPKNSIDGILK